MKPSHLIVHTPLLLLVAASILVAPLPASAAGAEGPAEIVSLKKIWEAGHHNAFTDLIRFQEKWFCSFREADAHVGGDGKIRILESADGDEWKSAALLTEDGVDLRDPKLSIMRDNRLMVVAGGSIYGGTKTLQGRIPRVAFSKDGHEWTATRKVLGEGEWLWRATWNDGRAYGVSYNLWPTKGPDKPEDERTLKLYTSKDGLDWQLLAPLAVPDKPNETTLRFLASGELMALVRREAGNRRGWVGTSKPPFTEWNWKETTLPLGGPNFIQLPDGSLIAASRGPGKTPGSHCILARLTMDSYEPILEFPSGGDCSYPGLVWHDGLLWVSYYSSHEGKTSIYLAKVRLPSK